MSTQKQGNRTDVTHYRFKVSIILGLNFNHRLIILELHNHST